MREASTYIGLLTATLLSALVASAEIDLGGSKDKVISFGKRAAVLEAGAKYLEGASADDFAESIEGLQNPFVFEQPVEEVLQEIVETGEAPKVKAPEPIVVYDDAAVLDVIAKSLAGKIRGTMGMSDTYYLQLEKGGLMKAGASFPARIPETKDQAYTVTLTEVGPDDFTLRLREVEKSYPIPKKDVKSTGRIEFSE